MFCSLCKEAKTNSSIWSTTGCNYMKVNYVKRHEKSKEHKSAVVLLDPNQTGIKEGITRMLGSGTENVLTQMRNVYFLSIHHLALNIFSDLSQFVTYQFQNTGIISSYEPLQILRPPTLPKKHNTNIEKKQSNYATYTNKVAGHEFLKSISRPVEEAVINEIHNSTVWSLLIDESNTHATAEKTLALVSKHMVNNLPTLRYLGMAKITNASAESLKESIDAFIKDYLQKN